ncbi:aldehyde dehydrogenase family protein [Shimwellia pseudoproteus]|uniref:aldehyde dehydrogenase family protein n=1 Tax=Shimwellia pseudoproteus TaxID=570012 RepID=UPI0018EDDD7A|nr:aldehyde dehydrogenase family protein [Shimwellia pseudoproteus]MBJ3815758.1 aldehyde dehydrogenase family protein [Shimwellia pseudoproteus]
MHYIDQIYINGAFVTPHGEEQYPLYNPATEEVIGYVRLADEHDALQAIAAAKAAFPGWAATDKAQRIAVLARMHAAVAAREETLFDAIVTEYGAPRSRARWMAQYPADVIRQAISALENFAFTEQAGSAEVIMTPVGVAGLITPWNSDAGFICNKLATAMAAGCTAAIKPSEMSGIQTQIISEALHEAQVPAGVFNIITGRGDVVGEVINRHPDIAKISFTGSTAVGKHIVASGAQSLKRVTLELGGKSPTLILDDADLGQAVPLALAAGFMNNGQACVAGTRILVPASRQDECEQAIRQAVAQIHSGYPEDPRTDIGPMVSHKQWQRVQSYIQLGIDEGARLLTGGTGRPGGMTRGWCVKPTVFVGDNQMRIAREEIFGPVLVVIPYHSDAEAIALANDTCYGLSAVVLGGDAARGAAIARQIDAGRVLVNTLAHEPQAPFGGFKQSGQGREMGKWGMQAYLEPKTLLVG